MAFSSNVTVARLTTMVSAEEFNDGFNKVRDILVDRDSDIPMAVVKNHFYNKLAESISSGVALEFTTDLHKCGWGWGWMAGDGLHIMWAFTFPDENGSRAYFYEEEYVAKLELAWKTALEQLSTDTVHLHVTKPSGIYDHVVFYTSRENSLKTMVEVPETGGTVDLVCKLK